MKPYNPYGQRTGMELKNGCLTHTEIKTYDEYGRLVSIKSKGKTVNTLLYDIVMENELPDYLQYDFGLTK